ncbi:MAG TPA: T9SS type A sorting domain-containing protein [Tenuifilaceae bacterium]|nr:T9SS type A sorting domain-containing protein [Tenuifilaceae bacterium]
MKRTIYLASLLLIVSFGSVVAQSIVATQGGNINESSGSVSYTVGQVFYSHFTSDLGSANEGAQQPYEIYVVSSVENAELISLSVSAYPNPTASNITLKVESNHDFKVGHLAYQLYDVNGRLLLSELISSEETTIPLSKLQASFYLLKVYNVFGVVKTFKIIKK